MGSVLICWRPRRWAHVRCLTGEWQEHPSLKGFTRCAHRVCASFFSCVCSAVRGTEGSRWLAVAGGNAHGACRRARNEGNVRSPSPFLVPRQLMKLQVLGMYRFQSQLRLASLEFCRRCTARSIPSAILNIPIYTHVYNITTVD